MAQNHWYERARRWNQVNTVETDPRDCDLGLWRKYWRDHGIQGTIINAAGTVAYYPSQNPYQRRSRYLAQRDYFGDFVRSAREEGLAVVARIDSNQADESLYAQFPEWFCADIHGQPIRQTPGRYYTCINGEYYTKHLCDVVLEIIDRYHPDAFADNTLTGPRGIICYCENCKRKFFETTGRALPAAANFDDPTFRVWLKWNQDCRVERYRQMNELSVKHGGEDCVYMGMFKDAYSKGVLELVMDEVEYAPYNKAVMIDGQIRTHAFGFDVNALHGLATHETFGDETLVIESVATYALAPNMGRKAAAAPGETESWMRSAIIGGICPSTHFIGGVQEDRRTLQNGASVFAWHKKNEAYLFHRTPVSNVALVRSFRNACYYGQNDSLRKVDNCMYGMLEALKHGRIPYFPIDARQIAQKAQKARVMLLPEIAVLTDAELQSLEAYVRAGGSVVYTGATGMLDEWGYPRRRFPLDALFGISRLELQPMDPQMQRGALDGLDDYVMHNYIRIAQPRHAIFHGFEETPILSLHGIYYHVKSENLKELAHIVPPFPTYPPELSYMQDDKRASTIPAILAGETGYGGRVVYFAADYDRKLGETRFGDYARLLQNAILWALGDAKPPFSVYGKGELDCKLFFQAQEKRYVMQILNHSGLGKWPGSVEEYFPVGPESIVVRLGAVPISRVHAQNLDIDLPFQSADGEIRFSLPNIVDQELIVLS